MSHAAVRELLARRGLRPSQERGQNFLVDETLAERLVDAAGVSAQDSVIEVGAGLGILTRALARRAARVVSIEVDAGLVRALREEGLVPDAVDLRHGDARELDWETLLASLPAPRRVVANLPYSVATPLLRRFLDLREQLAGWSAMVQRELAQRMRAGPGEPDYGSFAVLHALCCRVERVLEVPPAAFHPRPRVRSSFVRVTPRDDSPLAPGELARVESCVRTLFQQRRKTLSRALRNAGFASEAGPALAGLGLATSDRAEDIAPETLLALARALPPRGRS